MCVFAFCFLHTGICASCRTIEGENLFPFFNRRKQQDNKTKEVQKCPNETRICKMPSSIMSENKKSRSQYFLLMASSCKGS